MVNAKLAALPKDTTHHSLGNQSPYGRIYHVEAAVIIAIMLIQLKKTECSTEVASLAAAARVLGTMRPCRQHRGGNVTEVYLRLPRRFPAFMPGLSSIVQSKCCCSLYPLIAVARFVSSHRVGH